jgi:CheY-like chemotaxis protein
MDEVERITFPGRSMTQDGRAPKKTGRVLLLDDETVILEIARELLNYLGFTAVTAQSAEEAVSVFNQAIQLNEPFDAVILDLTIPGGMGGKEVVRELLRTDPNVKAIISSGYLTDPTIQNYKEYGFAEVLTKPYDADELDRKLRKIIER